MDQLDSTIENFYNFVKSIISDEHQKQIASLDKLKQNVYTLIHFLPTDKEQLQFQIGIMKKYFNIQHLTEQQEKKLRLFVEYFVDIKVLLNEQK